MCPSPAAEFDPDALAAADAIAANLAETGWCVAPDFIPADWVAGLRREVRAAQRSGELHLAGIGRGAARQLCPRVRSDWIRWLDPAGGSELQGRYLARLEMLRLAVNRRLYCGLFEFEGHFAVYPRGAFYRRHLDRFDGVPLRTLTCILYLNRDWSAADGGQLRLYDEPAAPERYREILPVGGQLVTFLSARFPHEVMPAGRERTSLTGWFKTR